jgi:hypothetical protein
VTHAWLTPDTAPEPEKVEAPARPAPAQARPAPAEPRTAPGGWSDTRVGGGWEGGQGPSTGRAPVDQGPRVNQYRPREGEGRRTEVWPGAMPQTSGYGEPGYGTVPGAALDPSPGLDSPWPGSYGAPGAAGPFGSGPSAGTSWTDPWGQREWRER